MIEATPAVAVEQDVFQGQEPTFAEYSQYRKDGTVPERFKPAAAEPKQEEKPAATQEEAKTEGDKGASQSEQDKERDEQGKFKAKNEPLFTPDQQKAFDKAFARREAKLRREYDERIAAIESKQSQGAAPAKEPTQEAASSEPQPPEIPDITTFAGTAEEFQQALKDYPAKLAAYLDVKRTHEESAKTLAKRLADSEAAARKAHADFQEQFDGLIADVESGEEQKLSQHVLKAIAEDTDDPHGLTYYLATNREEYRRLAELAPNQALKEVLKLEFKLQREKEPAKAAPAQEANQKPTSKAPPPVEPVAARQTSKAFDVNDESMSADEWAAKRNKQVFGR